MIKKLRKSDNLESQLVIPDTVKIRLKDFKGEPIQMADVIIEITAFAKSKNDFTFSFMTDNGGCVVIKKKDILKQADEIYESGIMDYDQLEKCSSVVEISLPSKKEVEKRISNLQEFYPDSVKRFKSSGNYKNNISSDVIKDSWNGKKENYEYDMVVSV